MNGTEQRIEVWSARGRGGQTVTGETNGVVFGEWAAFESLDPPDEDRPRSGKWGVRNIPANLQQDMYVPKEVAVEAARLLQERLPGFGVGGINAIPKEQQDLWRTTWPEVKELALRKHPPIAARPYIVSLVKKTEIVVFAETEAEALIAIRSQPDQELEWLLEREDISTDAWHSSADSAAHHAHLRFNEKRPAAHMDSDRLFWVVGGKAYMPSHSPAQLYLAPTSERQDHADACPANTRRRSAHGPVEIGPCNCDARVFPAPPAGDSAR
jgi:hypothetical protein